MFLFVQPLSTYVIIGSCLGSRGRRNMENPQIVQASIRCLALTALAAIIAPTAMRPTELAPDLVTNSSRQDAAAASPTYYHDVRPILQKHCVVCHVAGGIAPMSFDTYESTHRYALIIRTVTQDKSMPPAFAVPLAGQVANNPALTSTELAILADWANAKAPQGSPGDEPLKDESSPPWSIPKPDLILSTAHPVDIPADGSPSYVYEIVPTHFRTSRWIQMAEVIPSQRANVLQIVVVVRSPGSAWLRSAPIGKPFATPSNPSGFRWANDDILAVFAPGSPATKLPSNTAKLILAGSDLVFRVQYAPNGVPGSVQSRVGVVFSKQKPLYRAATLALENTQFEIPPESGDYQVEARGRLARPATLLNVFPVMHLRGKQFEFKVVQGMRGPQRKWSPISVRVNYDRRWQPIYPLSNPLVLQAGTQLHALASYDNSSNNPANPDPHASVHWGPRTEDEVLQLFFDVAIPSGSKKDGMLIPD